MSELNDDDDDDDACDGDDDYDKNGKYIIKPKDMA